MWCGRTAGVIPPPTRFWIVRDACRFLKNCQTLTIGGIDGMPAGVAGYDLFYSVQFLERRGHAPEAPSRECCFFNRRHCACIGSGNHERQNQQCSYQQFHKHDQFLSFFFIVSTYVPAFFKAVSISSIVITFGS